MVSQTDSVFRAAGFDDIQRLGSRLVSLICNEAEPGEFKTEIILQPCLLLFFNSSSYLNAITLIVLLSLPFSCTVVVVSSSNRILCHVDGVKIKNTAYSPLVNIFYLSILYLTTLLSVFILLLRGSNGSAEHIIRIHTSCVKDDWVFFLVFSYLLFLASSLAAEKSP